MSKALLPGSQLILRGEKLKRPGIADRPLSEPNRRKKYKLP